MIGFKKDGLCADAASADACLLSPAVCFFGEDECEAQKRGDGFFAGGLYINDTAEYLGGGRFAITRKIKNESGTELKFKDILRIEDGFSADHYVIPCIIYNGNEHGSSNTPKELTVDGEPWVFSYDRTGIPSCTVTENENVGCALFADSADERSLTSSSSLFKKGNGSYEHRIIRPVIQQAFIAFIGLKDKV